MKGELLADGILMPEEPVKRTCRRPISNYMVGTLHAYIECHNNTDGKYITCLYRKLHNQNDRQHKLHDILITNEQESTGIKPVIRDIVSLLKALFE